MSAGKWLLAIAWSFICPGAAQAAIGKRRPALAWAAVGLVTLLAIPVTIWAAHAAIAAKLGAIVDAIVRIRRTRPARLAWNQVAGVATGAGLAGALYSSMFLETFYFPSSSMYPTVHIGDQFVVERLTLLWGDPARGDLVVFEHPCQPQVKYMKRVVAIANDAIEIRCNVVYVNGAAVPSQLVEGASCRYRDREEIQEEWFERECSRYRETLGGRSYDVFHDPERPARDQELARMGTLASGDHRDFPMPDAPPRSCSNAGPDEGEPSPAQQPGRLVETRPSAGPCEPQLHLVVPPGSLFVLGDNRPNSNDSRYWGTVPMSHVRGRVVGIYRPLSRIRSL